jgi:hypothetical protein
MAAIEKFHLRNVGVHAHRRGTSLDHHRMAMTPLERPTIATLTGIWRRSLLAWPDGRRDAATWVRWLQGPSFYVDLRQPSNRPSFTSAQGIDDLDLPQMVWLAGQEGFAGELLFEDGFFEWRREIDFQLTQTYSDAGSLRFEEGLLVEEGRDVSYIEHWHRDLPATRPVCAARLEDRENGCRGFLVRIGGTFMYARGRNAAAPAGLRLIDCVAAAASAVAARDLVDCEISVGVVTPEGWIIRRSSLPFKEGKRVDPRRLTGPSDTLVVPDVDRGGASIERRWSVADGQGAFGDLAIGSATVIPFREACP